MAARTCKTNIMRNTTTLKIITAIISSIALNSCDDSKGGTTFHDITIGDPESIWRVSGMTQYGLSLSKDCAFLPSDTAYYYVYFGKDGKGVAYAKSNGEICEPTFFKYSSEDGCHMDIECKGSKQTWVFARMTETSGQSICILYTKKTNNGIETAYWRQCWEMTCDTAMYLEDSDLRRLLKVPEARTWHERNIEGTYVVTSHCDNFKFENAELRTDGSFRISDYRDVNVLGGTYEVVSGKIDSLMLKYNNGRTETHPVVLYRNGFLMYMNCNTDSGEETHMVYFSRTNQDFGYEDL